VNLISRNSTTAVNYISLIFVGNTICVGIPSMYICVDTCLDMWKPAREEINRATDKNFKKGSSLGSLQRTNLHILI